LQSRHRRAQLRCLEGATLLPRERNCAAAHGRTWAGGGSAAPERYCQRRWDRAG
jgi:hypothetical protein